VGNTVAGELGATAVQLDVTDPASVTAAVGALGPAVGHLDVLLNNAGIAGEQQPPADATVDDLERVFAINVVGAARLLKECTPLLEASEVPNVVNLGSAVGSLTLNSRPAPVEVGVEAIVRMAMIDSNGPTGTFADINGIVPW
jgi:NAD(P)-dependent dehydrogenase (short-subunit alcohol dehydrogenase family)